ncbi:MAG: ABC transporter substrate-binding protein, partial [Chamaesiphon sp.]|nr:ABC transporter substrate-binding protein [Chamaesiphon sp.]
WIADSQSLEVALTNTRGELSAIEGDCPGSSILPILFTSPYDPPLKFPIAAPVPIEELSIWQEIIHILVIRPLVTIKFRGKLVKIPPIALIGLAIATIGYFQTRPPVLKPACNTIQGDRISCGEEIMLMPDSRGVQQDKQDGANAIANGDFALAVKLLTKAWDAKKDPETSIMLENAKLANQNLPIKSIAITIPGNKSTPSDIPTSMLKAVAFSQQQWNADPSHLWKLQVVIVDDRNNKVDGVKLADELLTRGIFAGIGSYSSEVTSGVKDIYKQHQTVLISGTSTADRLTNNNRDTYFFRVCSNNQISGKQIANYLKNHKYNKIVLFRTPGKTFSDSMTAALKANIQGIDIVKEFNFEGKGDPADYLKQARIAGAQAIVLIPDAYTSQDPERERLLSILKANNGNLPIIGNEVVKDQTLFNYSKQQLQKLVISLPWHPSSYQNNIINIPNFWGAKAQLDHRIAMTYDATQVLITALDRLPIDLEITKSRQELQKIISNPTFDIGGITGQISFTGSDRSQTINSLVQPQCDATKCSGFEPAR